MNYNQYRMIFYVSFTAFSIMLIASIVILIVLEIPKVIGALTGKSARNGRIIKAGQETEILPGDCLMLANEEFIFNE